MKIKDGFLLREIGDSWIVVPIGQRVVEFNSLISLSESGALLWKKLEKKATEKDLVLSIMDEYEIDEATAREDVMEFISSIKEKGLIEP